jgi:hypothetical protein
MNDRDLDLIRMRVEAAVAAADIPGGLEYLAAQKEIDNRIEQYCQNAVQTLANECLEQDRRGEGPVILRTDSTGEPTVVMLSYAAFQRSLERYEKVKADADSLAAQLDGSRRQGGHSD